MKVQSSHTTTIQKLKWSAVIVLLIATVAVNVLFMSQGVLFCGGLSLVLITAALGLVYTTETGAKLVEFFSGARTEVRRVVWPTRQETVQATLLVMAAVVVMSIVLWGVDSLLFYLMALFTA